VILHVFFKLFTDMEHAVNEVVAVFDCTYRSHQSRDFWRLIRHYQCVHSNEAGFRVKCVARNCYKTYTNVKVL
jgi:hypothetical protein